MRRWLRLAVVGGGMVALAATGILMARSTGRAAGPHGATTPAATPGTIVEFALPTASRVPEAIVAGPDGNLWFTESQAGGAIGRVTPSGTVTEFAITTPNSGAFWITVGPDANLWFTEATANKIGKMSPAGAMLAEYTVPTVNSSPNNIIVGPDGNLWFTEFYGDAIGKISTAGALTEVAHLAAGAGPTGMAAGADGSLWFVEQKANKIGKITTAGTVTEFVLAAGRTPAEIAAGSDANLWFTEFDGNRIGKITTAGSVTEFAVPTAGSQPGSIAAGIDGNLWFTEQTGNNIGRIKPDGTITEFGPIPTAASGPGGITSGPDGNLWFTERIGNKIGRQALSCNTWTGAVDGNFGTAGNWSYGGVPGAADDACIIATTTTLPPAKADTYTVLLNGNFSIHSLALGGPNGTQTLLIPANMDGLGIAAASTVNANGVLTMGSTGTGYSLLNGGGATLTNSGHLNTTPVATGGDNRYVRTNLVNAAGGTVDIAGSTLQDGGATTTTNNGAFTVEASGGLYLVVTNGQRPSFVNSGGSITNNGIFNVDNSIFTQRAGTESGNAVVLTGGAILDDDTSAGAAGFKVTAASAGGITLTGTGPSPGVGAGQVLTIAGTNLGVGVLVSLTNAGTIMVGDNSGSGYSLLGAGQNGSLTLTNTGHLNFVPGGLRYLRINLINAVGGMVDVAAADTRQDGNNNACDPGCNGPRTLTTNNGVFTVEAGGGFGITGGSSFTNSGGSITNNGSFSEGSGTFTQRGGTTSGNAIGLSAGNAGLATLDDDTSAGVARFLVTGATGGGIILTGSGPNPGVGAGQVVTIAGTGVGIKVLNSLTNAGTIAVGDTSGTGYSLIGEDQNGSLILTNTGRLNFVPGGLRYLRINLINAAGGIVDVAAADTRQDGNNNGSPPNGPVTTTTNNGTFTVEAGAVYGISGGSSFANGGAVTNNGAFSLTAGKFTQRGTESGNAIVIADNSTLDDDLSAGAGQFKLTTGFSYGDTLTGSGPNPGIAAGQVVTLASNDPAHPHDYTVATNFTNAGTIFMGDGSSTGPSVLANAALVTLTNTGLLNTIVGGGGYRYLRLNVTNAASGAFDIAATTVMDLSGRTFTNHGTLTLETTGLLALGSGATFAQDAAGTFATTIDANATKFGQLDGGGDAVSIDGTLKVTTVGKPAVGSSWPIISNANRSGMFASHDFGYWNYDLQYPATGVTLVALATCNVWIGGDGNFGTATNWSLGAVPASTDDACINATTTTIVKAKADTYTVLVNGDFPVKSLTLGAPNGTQTLDIQSGSRLTLLANSSINARGVMVLGDAGIGDAWLGCVPACSPTGPTLTNNGTLKTIAGGGGIRHIQVMVINAVGATLDIGGVAAQTDAGCISPGGAANNRGIINNGTVTVEADGNFTPSCGFVNSAGATVANNGVFRMWADVFVQRGSESGNPVTFTSGSGMDDDLSAGPGSFVYTGGSLPGQFNSLGGYGPNPGIPAGQTITIASDNTYIGIFPNMTNAGTIILGDNSGTGDSGLCCSYYTAQPTIINTGTIKTVQGSGGIRHLQVNVANSAGGIIDIGADTRQDQACGTGGVNATTITNNGTFTIEATGRYAMSSCPAGGYQNTFTQGAGGTFATTVDVNATKFGQLTGGTVNLDGKLRVTTVGWPSLGSTWPIISGATRSGTFAGFDICGPDYNVEYGATSATLAVRATIYTTQSTTQETLGNSDGASWVDMDPGRLSLTFTPSADSYAILSGNADLWTSVAGYNQDLGISVSGSGQSVYPTVAGQPEAWKESGGFAGTFSPNAAFVQTVVFLKQGQPYTVKLVWKANKNASGATIWAGAGPIGSTFSPTRLTAQLLPASTSNLKSATITNQPTQSASDGATWKDLDPGLSFQYTPCVNGQARLSGNVDLWTSLAGYNQDVGISVTGGAYPTHPGQPEAWKESGGNAGTFSPNAAFAQGVIPLSANTTYTFKLTWKTNIASPASGAIWAGAGPIGSRYSPTRLVLQFMPTGGSVSRVIDRASTTQYTQSGSDGATWVDMDVASATPLTFQLSSTTSCVAVLSANADLWTSVAGYNQDIGITVSGGAYPTTLGQPEAWKESGGFAGTFSPNAAYVQTVLQLAPRITYTVKVQWKTNVRSPSTASIYTAAGAINATYSPTRLTAQLLGCT